MDKIKNINKVENKLINLLEKLSKLIKEYPEHTFELTQVFEIAEIHSKNIIFAKQFITESVLNKEEIDETIFKGFIIDANEFVVDADTLLKKFF